MNKPIEIFGQTENLEKVRDKAWELKNFGSTCLDGNELDIYFSDFTEAHKVSELIDYAQENSCYINVRTAELLKSKYGFKKDVTQEYKDCFTNKTMTYRSCNRCPFKKKCGSYHDED